ncbi:MAG: hypothetical protein IKH75_10320 [Ruminococcus sp.]|nr:hypothetical protein [Ruminococcus sp.]
MQDLRVLADFMTEFWKLIKETVNEEQTDEYWQALMERAAKLGRTKLEQKLIMTYLDFQDGNRK